jgi:hypothetical protein
MQMRRNVRKHVVAHEAAVSNVTAAAPDVREYAIEEFRARFCSCLDHELPTHMPIPRGTFAKS